MVQAEVKSRSRGARALAHPGMRLQQAEVGAPNFQAGADRGDQGVVASSDNGHQGRQVVYSGLNDAHVFAGQLVGPHDGVLGPVCPVEVVPMDRCWGQMAILYPVQEVLWETWMVWGQWDQEGQTIWE